MSLKLNKKRKLQLIAIVISLISFALIYLASSIYVNNYKRETLCSFDFDNGYVLDVAKIGKTKKDTGITNCKFELKKDEEVVNTYKFELLNGEKEIDDSNFEVDFMQDNIRIIVSSTGQNDLIYFLKYYIEH